MAPSASRRRWRTTAFLAAAVFVLPSTLGAQAVVLRIQPKPGDTLHTRFEQEMAITGRARRGDSDTTVVMQNSMLLLSRVIVQSSDDSGTVVLAITDSVALLAGGRGGVIPEGQRRAMQGGRVRMRISPQGTAVVLDAPAALAADLQASVSQMPATLPARAIRVGSSWTQEMIAPITGQAGTGPAKILATFRLDSLTRGGEVAHISIRGTISRDSLGSDLPHGGRMHSSGTLSGQMQVDRRRGWWTDTRATILLHTVMMPPAGSSAEPRQFETRMSHRIRTERP